MSNGGDVRIIAGFMLRAVSDEETGIAENLYHLRYSATFKIRNFDRAEYSQISD